MSPDGWRALRRLALEGDTTLNALAIEAFNDLLRKYGKKASVENPLVDGAGFRLRGQLIELAMQQIQSGSHTQRSMDEGPKRGQFGT